MPRKSILLTALLVAACAQRPMTPILVPPAPVSIPAVQPLSLAPVEWEVQPGDPAKFALSADGYRNLNLNFVEIRRFMEEQQAVIAMLRRVLEDRARSGETEQKPRP